MPESLSIQNQLQSHGSRPIRASQSPQKILPRHMKGRAAFAAFFLLVGSSIAFASRAEDQKPSILSTAQATATESAVEALLTQRKVVRSPEGIEKYEDASTVKPGDVIEYQVVYTNRGAKAVSGLVADLPIPEGLAYQPKSAKPGQSRVKVATKDGVFSAEPLSRNVAGKSENIPYADYRSLRWSLGQLPAHGVTTVTARAQVEAVVPVLPAAQDKQLLESSGKPNPPNPRR